MRDSLYPIPIKQLLPTILSSLKNGCVFGVYTSLFFMPNKTDIFKTAIFGQDLETPIGLAAGPHTQMAQNIITGWLCGARYIELKTIQTLDEIKVSKPCIDINDEGYNCEWSQELKIKQSFEEYLKAWIIIHILRHELKYSNDIGTVFNMSVGYDMKGILNDNVQWFFDKMKDSSLEKAEMINKIRPLYPEIDKINIPDTISNNITLSTMHGCPSDEIEKIGHYLLTEKKLHAFIKLNPTLLGKEDIQQILNKTMDYETHVPDVAFEHDIHFDAACELIESLQKTAKKENLFFGIKLTNTLEAKNHKDIFSDESMYMSGKALHPISINVAAKLRKVFPELAISFCGGVNANNVADVLSCGLNPVTVCSDILLPGGYTRLLQYLENIEEIPISDHNIFLKNYAESVKKDLIYQHKNNSIKTTRALNTYDCISAPCVDTCPTHQNIPAYLAFINRGENEKALQTILSTNPFPSATGMICDHSCQTKCTRVNYDDAIRIRDIKRYIAENTKAIATHIDDKAQGKKISVIGAGPSGLSCAYYLALMGCDVDVYETKSVPGGMLADVIPEFRLSEEALKRDIDVIKETGVRIYANSKVDKKNFNKLRKDSDYVYVAIGAQNAMEANIPGGEGIQGYLNPLKFLSDVKNNKIAELGDNIIILGGGNTAIDVARTARRVCSPNSTVSIVYRRTQREMPADKDEILAALEENIQLLELASPAKIISKNGKIKALECHKMRLEKAELNARPKPVIIPGEGFELSVDTLIPAFGQSLDVEFMDEKLLQTKRGLETQLENVFIGGDAYRGASFLIKAVADGKDVAIEILSRMGINTVDKKETKRAKTSREKHHQKLSRIIPGVELETLDLEKRQLSTLVDLPMSETDVVIESARCVNCDEICDVCITVCPNRANVGFEIKPYNMKLDKVMVGNGNYTVVRDDNFIIEQEYQIMNIADYCNECGNCTSFCPTSGRPFVDKPNIALCEESFNSLERGYWNQGDHIFYKQNDCIYRLDVMDDKYVFSSKHFSIRLDKEFAIQDVELKNKWIGEISLHLAVNMKVLKEAIESMIN
ncbi:MAG: putative selenate reductase subunit YgfK [Candidatus Marinimicrobia bacterium]|nr:putative selenate reductase subunit YgfK [Candidatus Neomarinimicrobiota bacterium]